jgi:hypothetical protein
MSGEVTFVLVVLCGLMIWMSILGGKDSRRIDRLEHRVDCLEHPHGESSVAATKINGRFRITQPATRTGCP